MIPPNTPIQVGLDSLKSAENILVEKRRLAANEKPGRPEADAVGIALSGGGIRSATFCLGLLQGIAKHGLIRKVDYLSTVSGGGYFGSFLGRMFTRDWTMNPVVLAQKSEHGSSRMRDHLEPAKQEFLEKLTALPAGSRPVDRVTMALQDNASPPMRWLRGAGNYLTPNLSSDGALAVSVFVRNWLAVLVVMLISVLAIFLFWDLVRYGLGWFAWMKNAEFYLASITDQHIWWTPAVFLPVIVFALFVLPLGWAYWLTQAGEKHQTLRVVIAILVTAAAGGYGYCYHRGTLWLVLAIESLLALVVYCLFLEWSKSKGMNGHSQELTRSELSRWLSNSLIFFGATIVFSVLDSWSQSIYALVAYVGNFQLAGTGIATITGVAVLAPLAKQVAAFSKHKDSKISVPFQVLALVGSLGFAFVWLLGIAYLAQGIAWRWGCPEPVAVSPSEIENPWLMVNQAGTNKFLDVMIDGSTSNDLVALIETNNGRRPYLRRWQEDRARKVFAEAINSQIRTNDFYSLWSHKVLFPGLTLSSNTTSLLVFRKEKDVPKRSATQLLNRSLLDDAFQGSLTGRLDAPGQLYAQYFKDQTVTMTKDRLVRVGEVMKDRHPMTPQSKADLRMISACTVLAFALCLLLGRTMTFLNLSSFHMLYTARLIRAYLGASNPARWSSGTSISDVMPGDDIAWDKYRPHDQGGPLHLVNVAINSTVSLDTGMDSETCKGMNLCLGPAGMSFGDKHALGNEDVADPKPPSKKVFLMRLKSDEKGIVTEGKNVEALPLGDWVGISGAAFTTGLGNVGGGGGTSLGTSLLCGLFNVRLGYWWRNSFAGDGKKHVDRAFPVQTYLADEFTGSFYVQKREHWYLSDGGHFENTAAYELIRRQVPFIVVADCGADQKGDFDDIANLMRRVRLDFGAEITFLTDAELGGAVSKANLAPCVHSRNNTNAEGLNVGRIGILEDLRPIAAKEDECERVKAHATIARVTYPGTQKQSTILFIKPGITDDLPPDLVNYQRSKKDFPQQSTLDQFFDEAQWESYRKLGECIASRVFDPSPDGTKWFPGKMQAF